MMKKILIVVAVIFAIIGSGLFWVDSKIDKQKISKLIIEKIENTLVGTKAEIFEIKYNLGFSLNFEVSKLSIFDAKSKKLVIGVNQASIDLNILAILFGSGKIDININSPILNLIKESNADLNIQRYIKNANSNLKQDVASTDKEKKGTKVEVPNFIEKSSLNFKLTNLEVNYTEKKTSTFVVDRILIKDLGFSKNTAYEFISSIDYKIDDFNNLKAKVYLLGEISLKDIVSRKSFALNTYLYIKDISSTLLKSKVDDIETKINFRLDEKSNIAAQISSKSKDLVELEISVNSQKEDLNISIKQLELKLAKIIQLIGIKELNAYKATFTTVGDVKSNLSFSEIEPRLKSELTSPVTFNIMNKVGKVNTISLDIQDDLFSLVSTGNIVDGDYKISTETRLNLLDLPRSIDSLNKITTKISFINGVIPKEWIQFDSDPNDTSKEKSIDSNSSQSSNLNIKLPITETYLNVSSLKLDKSVLNAKGKIRTLKNKILSDDLVLDLDESKTAASFAVEMNKKSNMTFNLATKKLNLLSFKALLPENLDQLTGILDIKTSGNLILSEQIDYNIKGFVNAQNGSLKGFNLRDIVISLVGDLSKYLPNKDIKVSEEYEMLNLEFEAKPSNIFIKDLRIVGKNKSIDLDLKGNIAPKPNKSELIGELLIKDIVSDVKKISSKEKLPILLKGEGYFLKPSTSYTTSKLIKGKANSEINKVKSKLKDKAKDFFKGLNL